MCTLLLYVEAVKLDVGDKLKALPGKEYQPEGKDYYKEGDLGRITKFETDDKGVERLSIAWERTGLTSTVTKEAWLEYFKLEAKAR